MTTIERADGAVVAGIGGAAAPPSGASDANKALSVPYWHRLVWWTIATPSISRATAEKVEPALLKRAKRMNTCDVNIPNAYVYDSASSAFPPLRGQLALKPTAHEIYTVLPLAKPDQFRSANLRLTCDLVLLLD